MRQRNAKTVPGAPEGPLWRWQQPKDRQLADHAPPAVATIPHAPCGANPLTFHSPLVRGQTGRSQQPHHSHTRPAPADGARILPADPRSMLRTALCSDSSAASSISVGSSVVRCGRLQGFCRSEGAVCCVGSPATTLSLDGGIHRRWALLLAAAMPAGRRWNWSDSVAK